MMSEEAGEQRIEEAPEAEAMSKYRATCRVCATPLNRDTGAALEPSDCPACRSAAADPSLAPLMRDALELEVTGSVRVIEGLENTQWMKLGHLRFLLAPHGLALCPLPGARVSLPGGPAKTEAEERAETPAETRARLVPVMARLVADGKSEFLDLCEMLLMFSEKMSCGMLKWDHPRVLVHIKHARPPKKAAPEKTSKKAALKKPAPAALKKPAPKKPAPKKASRVR